MHQLCFVGLLIPLFLLSITIIIIGFVIGISMIIIFDFVSVIEMFFSQRKGFYFYFFLLLFPFHQGSVWGGGSDRQLCGPWLPAGVKPWHLYIGRW